MEKRKMTVVYAPGVRSYKVQQPMIRITNKFLLSSGFHVGDPIEVMYQRGIITITKLAIKQHEQPNNTGVS